MKYCLSLYLADLTLFEKPNFFISVLSIEFHSRVIRIDLPSCNKHAYFGAGIVITRLYF